MGWFQDKHLEDLAQQRVLEELIDYCIVTAKNLVESNVAVMLLNLNCVSEDDLQPPLRHIQLGHRVVANHLQDQRVAAVEHCLEQLVLLLVLLVDFLAYLAAHLLQDVEDDLADFEVLENHLVLLLGQDLFVDLLQGAVLNEGNELAECGVHKFELLSLNFLFNFLNILLLEVLGEVLEYLVGGQHQ